MPVSDLPDPLTPEEWERRYGPAWTVPDSEFPPDPPSRAECLDFYRRTDSVVPLSVLEGFLRTLDEEDLQFSLEVSERF